MPFLLDGNPSPSEISEAINYILANLALRHRLGNTLSTTIQKQVLFQILLALCFSINIDT